jgi:hypothetical protein
MLVGVAEDVIGSVHELLGGKSKEIPLFTELSRFTDGG